MKKPERKASRIELDRIDHKILAALASDGRMAALQLAETVGLSPTPCSRRVKRLEEAGVIVGYEAKLNPAALGLTLCVVIGIRLGQHDRSSGQAFSAAIQKLPEITECLQVTGATDYLLRAWVADVEALKTLVGESLQSIPGVVETSTTIILDVMKSTATLGPAEAF